MSQRRQPGDSLEELGQLMDREERASEEEEWRDDETANHRKRVVRSLRGGKREDRCAEGETGQDGDEDRERRQRRVDGAEQDHDQEKDGGKHGQAKGQTRNFAGDNIPERERRG